MSICLCNKWLWIRISLQSHNSIHRANVPFMTNHHANVKTVYPYHYSYHMIPYWKINVRCVLQCIYCKHSHKMHHQISVVELKGCVGYIFASLFNMSKREHLWNKEKLFLFHFESSSRSWDNQLLIFLILKYHDVIKCPNMKHETHVTE